MKKLFRSEEFDKWLKKLKDKEAKRTQRRDIEKVKKMSKEIKIQDFEV